MKIEEAHAEFVTWLERTRDVSPHTIRAYSGDISALQRHVGSCMQVANITSDTIVDFVQAQRGAGIATASIRRRLAGLRSFSRWLVDRGQLKTDPWAQLTLKVRKRRTLPRPVPPADLATLLNFLSDEAHVPLTTVCSRTLERPHEATTLLAVTLMFTTVLRVSEAVGIKCNDLDIADRTSA
jgi:integrase/recombinase XerC